MARQAGSQRVLFYIALFALFLSLVQTGALLSVTARTSTNASITMCVNRPPTVEAISNETVSVGQTLLIFVNASDPNNQSVSFADNTSLFNVSSTGNISYLALVGDVGVHDILITVTDNGTACNASASTSFHLTVLGVSDEAGIGGGGGGGGVGCTVRWQCAEYGQCVAGRNERKCVNVGSCPGPSEKFEYQDCVEVECVTDAHCHSGSVCDASGVCVEAPSVSRPRVEVPAPVPIPPLEAPVPGLPEFVPFVLGLPEFFARRPALLLGVIGWLLAIILLALIITFWPPMTPTEHSSTCRFGRRDGHRGEFHHGHSRGKR